MLRHVSCNELRTCVFAACQDSHIHCCADLSRDLCLHTKFVCSLLMKMITFSIKIILTQLNKAKFAPLIKNATHFLHIFHIKFCFLLVIN